MYEVFARSRVAVNRHIGVAEGYANNARLYEATGVGALLMNEVAPNLSDLFEPGREVVAYEGEDDLVAKVRHYAEHDDERRRSAAAGPAAARAHLREARGRGHGDPRGAVMTLTRQFCTLFDSGYLFKAVALYDSLECHCESFHLTALCFDEEAERILNLLSLPHLSVLPLAELERSDPGLLAAKADRNRFEYCCTATPALPLYLLLTRPDLDEITYLDADLFFFSAPEPLFEEMGNASVLITPHRFPPYLRHYEANGIYNVQFMTFRRTDDGLAALRWWHERCIEWCYLRLEDDKFADQKYLDDWPDRFTGVHVLRHEGGGLAPWNLDRFELRDEDGRVTVAGNPLVFFHFHRVRIRQDGYDWRARGYLGESKAYELVYRPYLVALDEAKQRVWSVDPAFRAGILPPLDVRQRLSAARADIGVRVSRLAPRLAQLRHRRVL